MEDDVGLVSIADAYSRRFHAGEFHKIEIVFNLAFGDLLWGERNAEVVKVSSIGRSEGESKPSARPATLRPKRPPGQPLSRSAAPALLGGPQLVSMMSKMVNGISVRGSFAMSTARSVAFVMLLGALLGAQSGPLVGQDAPAPSTATRRLAPFAA